MKLRTLAFICCCVLWIALIPANAAAGEAALDERIVVHGAGAVEARPDVAVLQLRIATLKPTTQQAMSEAAEMVARVGSVAADLGIEEARIATQTLTLAPQYSQQTIKGQRQRKRIGFRAAQTLRIEVTDIERLPPLIDRLSNSEILQVLGLQFVFAKPEDLLVQARRRAIKNARARADLYAAEAGVKVGRVISIVEDTSPGIGVPRPLARAAASVPPGQRRLTAGVTVTYAIRYGDGQ
ncbi:MAG: SIMPL domain-containing protein [Alphaproteobacteria bacterium]|nr:SIMPL domain-containing protein [Alphaproteobacteria bacterium]